MATQQDRLASVDKKADASRSNACRLDAKSLSRRRIPCSHVHEFERPGGPKVPSWDFEKKSHGISRALAKIFCHFLAVPPATRDQDVVAAAGIFLNEFRVSIYVDWKDDTMPTVTSPESASRIKARIRENNKFILLATNNAVASRWVPWELRVADDAKGETASRFCPSVTPVKLGRETNTSESIQYLGNDRQ